MATLDVVTTENKKAGSVELPPAVFEVKVKPDLFHAEVRRQLAARHAGTHSTKNRAAVSGGGAKPWRQKGTGRARQGTTRAPQWAGGGSVFGPVPRSYDHSLPKKVRRAALRGALSLRQQEGAITVVEDLSMDEYKTKHVAGVLEGLGLGEDRVLIVIAEEDAKLEKSTKNLAKANILRVAGLNVYDVLRHPKLLLTKGAVEALDLRLSEERRRAAKAESS
ncbi:MAG: 50S ribosomal protein L4 [Myxococcota bacterium]